MCNAMPCDRLYDVKCGYQGVPDLKHWLAAYIPDVNYLILILANVLRNDNKLSLLRDNFTQNIAPSV